MKVAIIGCGLIGRKRALAISDSDKLVACCDSNKEAADRFASEFNCQAFYDFKALLDNTDCEAVIVAVVNKYIREITLSALEKGCHVIAEKPLGRNAEEAEDMVREAERRKLILKTGFNHRFHPALWNAKKMANDGDIGKIFNIRARYGHGGRPGMESEWRASKEMCGGGELLDQGVHVIDLIMWFGGAVSEVYGTVETKFWPLEIEDNAFSILKTVKSVTASFHVSWTNWKNIFSFEVFGTNGYLRIEGLGGSYGPETLEFGVRKSEGGRPDVKTFTFEPDDVSWKNEWSEFKSAIQENREPIGSGKDGLMANKVIKAIYEASELKRAVNL